MYFNKIKNYIEGYPNENNYKIYLSKALNNVSRIKLISSEFPNTEKVVKKTPESKRNNKLYFQILEDGEKIYIAEISPGNYSTASLADEIQARFEEIERISFNENLLISIGNNAILEKSQYLSTTITINQFTDVVSISLFTILTVSKPISLSTLEYSDGHKRIIVNHVNHNLSVGDNIRLENCIATENVGSTVLNASHNIESIMDEHNYVIKLPLHNKSNNSDVTGGGDAVNILVPVKFRLLFNYSDTIGTLLGFRNVGEVNSITRFSKTVSNNISYENDYFKDQVGNEIFYDTLTNEIKNNVLQLSGDNYILMTCDIFKQSESLSSNNIKSIFAKLLLSDAPGSILYNQFVQLAEDLENPIKTLNELELAFYSPDGTLFDFNGVEHSFTLEFYEKLTNVEGTKINVKDGSINLINRINRINENSKKMDITDFNI